MRDPRLGLRRQGLIQALPTGDYQVPRPSFALSMLHARNRSAILGVCAYRTLGSDMQFDTKIALIIRNDLAAWQKLNVAAFLASGIAAAFP